MNKPSSIVIREMRKEELAFAAECTAAEGWLSEDRATLEGFFLKDPQGCLVAVDKGRPVGICVATFYGNSGFIGELIVRPEARGRGLGTELLNRCVRILMNRGAETIYLDGAVRAVELYERNGFHKVCRSLRFTGHLTGKPGSHVRRMAICDLDQVNAMDTQSFGADRRFFLKRRVELFAELSHVMIEDEKVVGYVLGRGGDSWVSAGPWVVKEDATNPEDLLSALAFEAGERPIYIGILETNPQACDLARRLGFQERADSPWRMALGHSSDLGASPRCYAVGSAAKG